MTTLREWLGETQTTLSVIAEACGLTVSTVSRLADGKLPADADTVETISRLTGRAVTAQDMHETRLAWLRDNRPDKFPDDAGGSLVEAAGSPEPPPFADPAATVSNDAAAPIAGVQAGAAFPNPVAAPAELPEAAE